MVLEYFFCN